MTHKYQKPLARDLGDMLLDAQGACIAGSVARKGTLPEGCTPGGSAGGSGCGTGTYPSTTACGIGTLPQYWGCTNGSYANLGMCVIGSDVLVT